MARLAILRGDVANAARLVAMNPDTCPWLAGWLAFLDGRHDDVDRYYAAAVRHVQLRVGRQDVFFDDFEAIFYLLSLLSRRKHAELGRLAELIGQGGAPTWAGAADLLTRLAAAAEGRPQELPLELPVAAGQHRFTELLYHCCVYWLNTHTVNRQAVRDFADRAQRAGYVWMVYEAEFLLARLDERTASGQLELPASTGSSTSTARLVDVVPRIEYWQALLRDLTAFLEPAPAVAPTTRLTWLLSVAPNGEVFIEPREQKRGRTHWYAGRKLSLTHVLREDYPKTDQDREILGAARTERHYYSYSSGNTTLDVAQALPRLVGHPLLFTPEGTSICGAVP
jgi:hypothetical protein